MKRYGAKSRAARKRQESRASSEKEGAKRQRLLQETAEEREACLGKRKEAWKKKTAEAKGKHRLVFTTLCTNDTVAIQVEV